MNARERLLDVVRGETPDRAPVLGGPNEPCDAVIVDAALVASGRLQDERPVLAHVLNAYPGLVKAGALDKSPSEVEVLLDVWFSAALANARAALGQGAIGVFYEIRGAEAGRSTPMEYGGLFLERDRELLESISDAEANVLFVAGAQPYLDFLADLPANIFAYDAVASGISLDAVHSLRKGPIASNAPGSDVILDLPNAMNKNSGELAHA